MLVDVQDAVGACERNSFAGEWAKPVLFAMDMAWDSGGLSPFGIDLVVISMLDCYR